MRNRKNPPHYSRENIETDPPRLKKGLKLVSGGHGRHSEIRQPVPTDIQDQLTLEGREKFKWGNN
jgi:hypothetical protein